MKAVILVGGEGTRLRPLTLDTPKQMLPIMGKPMLEGVMSHLKSHGVDEAVLSLGYLPDKFLEAYPNGDCAGVRLHYAVEPTPLDTAGAVRFAADELGVDDTFLVVNGDVLTDLDVTALVAFHRSHGAEGTIALHPVDDPSRFGVVPTHDDGKVIAFVEKPPREEAPTNLINAGTYVFEPAFLERVPQGEKVSIERVTFPAMVAAGVLYAFADDRYWLDTGTPESFLQAHQDILDGVRTPGFFRETLSDHNYVMDGALVEEGAVVERSVIGARSVIRSGATVRNCVVMNDVLIEEGARLDGSILANGAHVGAGAQLAPTSVLGTRAVVAPGVSLTNARVEA